MDNELWLRGTIGLTTWHLAVTLMQQRIAGSLALIAFALCLLVGVQAGNSFSTTLLRAMGGMVGTYVVGLVLGAVAQKMLEENLKGEAKKLKELHPELEAKDR
jgi:hypothetical protein